ncbi:RpiB/LacA/LacB family sugar-phosphate isomerase [Candidatus Woesearchaeota archaeon]|jgi:ribose 5-phosphate isomerase B|nr:RpiB/LacA/LacB family sugar-phosphate isomerase [Candidatus Woesearchaeota archaeon]MBT5271768.1 RpiB/LacA/LacB family sugar-phosphate isomerase [Candidatus Woesearchaeota archaeon]MBT6041191.1 RpiB/LacA/LacB family sugar-phosphate isomerase [Candidatus Woesearchaeota archaeon]MBT6336312.1 RpiB/LacA/LacB family sugar-phosphate isomerase [Candidatus Woesearchaeota archaeon]MBT7927302.1 RpiB/LacA/LacB family sugar-phosphate isomerase [Candidatus Woesearchaeota archaeon]
MKIYLGADHGGYALKEKIVKYLDGKNIDYEDLTTDFDPKDDYPNVAKEVGKLVASEIADGKNTKGILICGTGTGVSLAANKVKGIRAAALTTEDKVLLARLHNDLNILCLAGLEFPSDLPSKVKGKYNNLLDFSKEFPVKKAIPLIEVFLNTKFEGGRHKKRVDMIC